MARRPKNQGGSKRRQDLKPEDILAGKLPEGVTVDEYKKLRAWALKATQKGGRNKFRAKPTEINGIRFASKKESQRYSQLLAMQAGGLIRDLELQKKYELSVNGVLVCSYVSDFEYWDVAQDVHVTEDVKGFKTRVYKLKKKLMLACHGIEIKEA